MPTTQPLAMQPQSAEGLIVEIGAIVPILVSLTPLCNQLVVDGYRLAYQGRRVPVRGQDYLIREVFANPENPSRIMARIEATNSLVVQIGIGAWIDPCCL